MLGLLTALLYRELIPPPNMLFLQTMANHLLILNRSIITILQRVVEVNPHRLLPLPIQIIMKDSQSPIQSRKLDIMLRKREYILRILETQLGIFTMCPSLGLGLPIALVLHSNNIIHRNHILCVSRLKFNLNEGLLTIQSLRQHLILPLAPIPHAKGSMLHPPISIRVMEGENLGIASAPSWKREGDRVLCRFPDLHPKIALWK